jgi:hypothetical protein
MLLGLDPNGGTGMSEEWAARLAIESVAGAINRAGASEWRDKVGRTEI